MDCKAYIKDYLTAYTPYKTYWNYEDGCVLKGCIDLYHATGDEDYRSFVLRYLENYVQQDGTISNYDTAKHSIDSFNCGKALFFALDETGDERYRRAIDFHMERLKQHPRCECGSFWHKENYPNQVWLDGLYMAQPFYMGYEARFDGMAEIQDVISQFKTVRRHLWNQEKGLNYHAWDEVKIQPWCSKETGCSANFWLRSTGWYLMALIDCIDLCPEMLYEHYRALVDLFRESMRGVLRYQDPESKLFYQVIDQADLPGNYTETSGSAMIAYSLLKAVRLGVMNEEKYLPMAEKIMEALMQRKLVEHDGHVELTDICLMAGLSDTRDGSAAYYLSEPRVSDDSKGVGPFMMAWAEYLQAKK